MEILKYKALGKESVLLGTFDLKVPRWGNLIINRCSYFKKGSNEWIAFPSQSYEKDGKKQYYPYLRFETTDIAKKFSEQVVPLLKEYIAKNPEAAPPPPSTDQMELPF